MLACTPASTLASTPPACACVQSAYTGVYAHGGPSTVDQAPANLASMCDRAKPAGSGSRRSTAECRVAALPGGAARRSTGELKHA